VNGQSTDEALTAAQFWEYITAMNLGLSDADIESMQVSLAADARQSNGMVQWKTALPLLIKIMEAMVGDKMDHWVRH
jgi:hypothetical protein